MKKTDEERKLFWDTLNGLHENSQECWDKLRAVYKPPEMLCRFRSVNKNTLQQLQENKLFFSSADRYDDPFDTYFYIDYAKVRSGINSLKALVHTESPQQIASILEKNGFQHLDNDFLMSMIESLKQTSPNLPAVVFPAPLTPSRAKISPRFTWKVSPLSTGRPP